MADGNAAPDVEAVTNVDSAADALRGMGLFGDVFGKEKEAERASAEPQQDTPTGDDAGPEETPATSEVAETGEPAPQEPAIDPPATWAAEDKDAFQALPRDLQEKIVKRERERERLLSERAREAAEARKSVETDKAQIQQERAFYAQQLQTFIPALQQQIAGEFHDIKTIADVTRLAGEDPARWAKWQAQQTALAHAQAEHQRIQEQQTRELETKRNDFIREQREKLLEKLPDLRDRKKAEAFRDGIADYLGDQGFSSEEIGRLADHRHMILIDKARRYDEGQKAKASAQVKTVPQVLKPGTAKQTNAKAEELTAALERQRKSGSIDDTARLLRAFRV